MVITIQNPVEWHARKRVQFVETAKRFTSEVRVSTEDEEFDGKSVLSLMRFSAPAGMVFRITADGYDAPETLQALQELIEHRFTESTRST